MAFLISECLCFISNQYDKLNRNNLTSTIDFFTLKELSDAKEILIVEYERVGDAALIQAFKTKRRENHAGAKTKLIKDLLDIWEVVDRSLGGKLNVFFAAANPNRLPSVNAEAFNLQFLIGAITKLQEKQDLQHESITAVAQSLTNVHRRLDR